MMRHEKVNDRQPRRDGKWLNQPSIIFTWQLQIDTNGRRSTRAETHTPGHVDTIKMSAAVATEITSLRAGQKT